MSSKAGKRLVPELRFPEFRDTPPWKPSSVKRLCELKAGQFVSASDIKEKPEKGLYPCYGGNGLRGYTKTFTHAGTYPLIGRQGALCGNVKQATGKFHATEHAVVVTPRGETNVDWLFHLLVTLTLNQYATGQAQPGLSVEVIERVSVAEPLPAEQQKIADCLSSIDDLITAQAQEIEALKAHKKGLMQRLFPAESETVPRLRFPEFREAGEWESKRLGDVAKFFNGRAYKQEELLASGKYKVLRVGNFFSNGNWYYSDLELEASKYCVNGDLLFAWSASFGPRIWSEGKAIFHYHIWKVVDNKEEIAKNFLFQYLEAQTEKMKQASSSGATMLHITKESIENWQIKLPTLTEQKIVADVLSSLCSLINAQTQKLEALKAHKKGLMQGLFPATVEGEA